MLNTVGCGLFCEFCWLAFLQRCTRQPKEAVMGEQWEEGVTFGLESNLASHVVSLLVSRLPPWCGVRSPES